MSVRRRYTSGDLDAMPDVEGTRYEIIDGELFVSRPITLQHSFVCSALCASLMQWSKLASTGYSVCAPGLIFDPSNDAAPDVVWISKSRLADGLNADGHLIVAPELIAEVLSPGTDHERRDRECKLKLYSQQAVSEYWIVDPRQQIIQVYRRSVDALQLLATLVHTDRITSPMLPGFDLRVADLWEPAEWLPSFER